MGLDNAEKNLQEPSMKWFSAIGYKDGIQHVVANTNFTNLAHGEVGKHYAEWCHCTHALTVPNQTTEVIERAKKAIADAESFILRETGFSPKEIWNAQVKLTSEYRNKLKAPFETILLDRPNSTER